MLLINIPSFITRCVLIHPLYSSDLYMVSLAQFTMIIVYSQQIQISPRSHGLCCFNRGVPRELSSASLLPPSVIPHLSLQRASHYNSATRAYPHLKSRAAHSPQLCTFGTVSY